MPALCCKFGRIVVLGLAGLLLVQSAQAAVRAPMAVAADIDRDVDKQLAAGKMPASPQADDAEFLRRAYLDLTGRIPTAEKAAAFLDSKDPQKRSKLIDELLASPEYGKHFGTIWANLIVAAGDPQVTVQSKPFISWLAKELNEGRGWDKIVNEMLTAQGATGSNPATMFTVANGTQPGLLGSAATRLFLGMQIQCAECHNHPFNKWKQADYWGMAAFFGRLRGASLNGKAGKTNEVSENATAAKGNNKQKGGNKGPAVNASAAITIPNSGGNKGAGKVVPARFLEAEALPSLPSEGPLRPALASWMTAAENPFFARATVNRLWGHLFGRGFVNPVDDFDNGEEPSHPDLLALLSKELIASGWDLKHLVRCLCNSKAYQRTSQPLPGNKGDDWRVSRMNVKVLTPEMMYDSLTLAMGVSALPGGLGNQPRYGDGQGKNAKGKATARPDPRDEFIRFFNTREDPTNATEFTHGIPQLLGLMNSAQFNQATPVVERVSKEGVSREKAVEELYLATLSRRPRPEELKVMLKYLDKYTDRKQACTDLLWILFNTNEFVLNH